MKKPIQFHIVFLLLACLALGTAACGGKTKKSMKGDEEVSAEDFVAFFDEIKLPYTFTDTLLRKKANDSTLISNTIFHRFLGDSIYTGVYKKEKPKLYAVGSFRNQEAETYLLVRSSGTVAAAWLVAIDKDMKPKASMALLSTRGPLAEVNRVTIDNKFTITQADDYRKPDGSTATYSAVYAYNTAGLFMEIMNDGLKKGEVMEIINPIDSLPATHARTGNYGADKKNYLTIRNGDSLRTFLFFMNMNKNSTCQGDLKGEAKWISRDSALYEAAGEACAISFKFSGSSVTITEQQGCGSRRPAGCSFNATYRKQAMPKKKSAVR